jgi:nucleotide-binding universal stress UspA family protein
VPLDGSTLAEAALPPAVELAKVFGAEVVLLEVVPLPTYALYDEGAMLAAFDPDQEIDESQSYLNGVARRLRENGIYARTRVELAKPEAAIAEVAAQERAGMIAMATHGRSGLARLVLGSVATGTLQRTNVPLLLVGPTALNIHSSQPQVMSAAAIAG